ncbi:MAG TPA: ACP phosphodiesterase [Pyrinomonadaceae bacterium]|nr:ACP phosphodiesterase [Pyrinomonadaceae bacterium]
MNHLAHFFLARRSAEAATGALLGDFVKGKIEADNFPEKMRVEIMIHRFTDAFTDTDAQILHSKDVFKNTRRRFAGIALDVAFDHFLARNWKNFTDESLREFANENYSALSKNIRYFPFTFQPVLQRMIADDWLFAYRNFERVGLVLQRMSLRVRGGESLAQAFDEIKANYEYFDEVFKEFFPRLQDFVIEKRKEISYE